MYLTSKIFFTIMVNFPLNEAQDPGFSHWRSLPNRKIAWPVSGTSSYVVVTNTYKPH